MSRTQLWVEKYRPTSIDDLASVLCNCNEFRFVR